MKSATKWTVGSGLLLMAMIAMVGTAPDSGRAISDQSLTLGGFSGGPTLALNSAPTKREIATAPLLASNESGNSTFAEILDLPNAAPTDKVVTAPALTEYVAPETKSQPRRVRHSERIKKAPVSRRIVVASHTASAQLEPSIPAIQIEEICPNEDFEPMLKVGMQASEMPHQWFGKSLTDQQLRELKTQFRAAWKEAIAMMRDQMQKSENEEEKAHLAKGIAALSKALSNR